MRMAFANAIGNKSFHDGQRGDSSRRMQLQRGMSIIEEQERENFISWLRGEFAAANAVIDALCEHLRMIGEAGEYEGVLSCIQQRRRNWGLVLHMQQFFPVSEVLHAIHQVTWRKQQQQQQQQRITRDRLGNGKYNVNASEASSSSCQIDRHASGNMKFPGESAKKMEHKVSLSQKGSKNERFVKLEAESESGSHPGALPLPVQRERLSGSGGTMEFEKMNSSPSSSVKKKGGGGREDKCQVENHSSGGSNGGEKDAHEHQESKRLTSERNESSQKGGWTSNVAEPINAIAKPVGDSCVSDQSGPVNDMPTNPDFWFMSKQEEDLRRSMIMINKNFVGNEPVDGKMVNVVEGLELYENVFDSSELSRLTSLIQELKFAGRQRKLRGQTFVVSKRPMKGNGREMIQFGVPIINVPLQEEITTGAMKDLVEPIPKVLENVINRLFQWQIIREKRPDSCIINFFNEGDHSQPHISPSHVERPFCIMSLLSECNMVFGRTITINHPGDYKGSLKISLHAGSVMVMQGNGADIAKYAICSSPEQRVTITFIKVQPKKGANYSTMSTAMPHSSSLSNSHFLMPVEGRSNANTLVPIPREGKGMNQMALNVAQTPGAMPVPSIHTSQVNPCLPSPRIPPLFTGPTGPLGTYPSMAVIPPAWSTIPGHTPRISCSGTGVFFPCSGSGSGTCQTVTLHQQQQGVLAFSSGLPRSELCFNGGISTGSSGASLSNSTMPNRLALDNFHRDTERSSTTSQSLHFKLDSAAPKSALNKDIVKKTPKVDSNGSRTPKGDCLNRTSSLSKRTAGGSN